MMNNIKETIVVLLCTAALVLLGTAAANIHKERETVCSNNLKQIYVASACYSADHDDYIPRMLQMKYNRGIFWSDTVKSYTKNYRYFYCPADEKRGRKGLDHDELLPTRYAGAYVSYGINGHLSGVHKREKNVEKLNNIKNPAYVIYYGDAQKRFLRSIGRLWAQDYYPVHENSMLAVMADGHAEKFNQESLGTYGSLPGWKRDVKRWKQWKK